MNTIIFLLKEILKTAQSIETKVDAVLRKQQDPNYLYIPIEYQGQPDPLSKMGIKWFPVTLEDGTQILVRRSANRPTTNEMPMSMEETQWEP